MFIKNFSERARGGIFCAAAAAGSILMVALAAGCGGSSHKSALSNPSASNSTPAASLTRGKGAVSLTINWPAQVSGKSRYIPTFAQSIAFVLRSQTDPTRRYTLTANRPAGGDLAQTLSFDAVIADTYTLVGQAKTEVNGNGTTVAQASAPVTVQTGQTASVDLALDRLVKSVVVSTGANVAVNATVNLTGGALDENGTVVLLPASALQWSIVSGAAATLTPDGVFTAGGSAGTTRVRLTYSDPGIPDIFGEADVTITTGTTTGVGLAPSSWPKLGGDAQNTGRVSPTFAIGEASGTQDFSVPLGPLDSTHIISVDTAVGPDGTVYVVSNKVIRAIDGQTGTEKWSHSFAATTNADISCAPTIGANGLIYTATYGTMYALSAQTGSVVWVQTVTANGQYYFGSPALATDGSVIMSVYGYPSGEVVAYDGTSGGRLWHHDYGGNDSPAGSPAIGPQGTVYVARYDTQNALTSQVVEAIQPGTGSILWSYAGPPPSTYANNATPIVGPDGTVYARLDKVVALDGTSGSLKWQIDVGHPQTDAGQFGDVDTPALGANGFLYVANTALDTNNIVNGVPVIAWTAETSVARFERLDTFNQITIGRNGTVYGFTANPNNSNEDLIARDGQTGAELWRVVLPNSDVEKAGSIAVGPDGRLYFGMRQRRTGGSNPDAFFYSVK